MLHKIHNGRALFADHQQIWVARGMCFYAIDYSGRRITPKYWVGTTLERLVAASRITRQLTRVGIHHLQPLPNGSILITLKKRAVTVSTDGVVESTFRGYRGNKPGHRGVCVTPDGTIFFGEYTLNMNRENDTELFRSTDNGHTFQSILTFPRTDVRHIHFVQWDKYERCLWLGTGDTDEESRLFRSVDNGNNWTPVGGGSQLWRAVGINCTRDYIYWGTDAGSVPDQNYIIRMNRTSYEIEKVLPVEGPCHGNAVMSDDTVYVSTGVEGGPNEADRYARLRMIRNANVSEVYKSEKDLLPFIIQYGVLRFPGGLENGGRLVVTSYGLKQYGEAVLVEATD